MISSATNPLVKRVRGLADRKHRRRESAFVVHGIQPVWQAVEAGADIEVLQPALLAADAVPFQPSPPISDTTLTIRGSEPTQHAIGN